MGDNHDKYINSKYDYKNLDIDEGESEYSVLNCKKFLCENPKKNSVEKAERCKKIVYKGENERKLIDCDESKKYPMYYPHLEETFISVSEPEKDRVESKFYKKFNNDTKESVHQWKMETTCGGLALLHAISRREEMRKLMVSHLDKTLTIEQKDEYLESRSPYTWYNFFRLPYTWYNFILYTSLGIQGIRRFNYTEIDPSKLIEQSFKDVFGIKRIGNFSLDKLKTYETILRNITINYAVIFSGKRDKSKNSTRHFFSLEYDEKEKHFIVYDTVGQKSTSFTTFDELIKYLGDVIAGDLIICYPITIFPDDFLSLSNFEKSIQEEERPDIVALDDD